LKFEFNLSWNNVDNKIITRMIKYGIPLSLNFIFHWILSVSDRYLIGIFTTNKEVGLYSISYNISNSTINLLLGLLMMAAYPIIIKAWNEYDKEYVEEIMNRILKYYLLN